MDITARTAALKEIKDQVLNLTTSPLYNYRVRENNLPVIGEGSHESKIMMIGEAPGKNEAKTGRPFCGSAGKILDELLLSINLPREQVYITNIVKDRPPMNRDPLPEEITLYGPFLDEQIKILEPQVIVTLGRFSMQYVLAKFGLARKATAEGLGNPGPISGLHGQVFEAETNYGTIKILPLYHPAAAIYNQSLKVTLREDFKALKNLL